MERSDPATQEERLPESAYWTEFWTHKKLLIFATLGISVGYGSAPCVFSVMGPRLIAEFHWPREAFTAISAVIALIAFVFPLVGWLNDLIGVRPTALIGVIGTPLAFAAYSLITGDIKMYALIYILQAIICITTTAITYTRLIVHYFTRARSCAGNRRFRHRDFRNHRRTAAQ